MKTRGFLPQPDARSADPRSTRDVPLWLAADDPGDGQAGVCLAQIRVLAAVGLHRGIEGTTFAPRAGNHRGIDSEYQARAVRRIVIEADLIRLANNIGIGRWAFRHRNLQSPCDRKRAKLKPVLGWGTVRWRTNLNYFNAQPAAAGQRQ